MASDVLGFATKFYAAEGNFDLAVDLGLTGAEPGVTDTPDAFFEALSLHRRWDR